MEEVYIVETGSFLPNESISNDEMESVLGQIGGKPSRGRAIVLRNNGIKSRYYALDSDGVLTHNNAQLVVEAIRSMFPDGKLPEDIDILSCGTSAADQSLPSHTAMVHGYLDQQMEIASPSGACCSGMHAMKYGYMAIRSGLAKKAISAGSELVSPMMLARNFESESRTKDELDQNPYIAFEKDFLRWMLSDGAGSALMCNEPIGELNLRIDWIESRSYANEYETCMYSAAEKNADGSLTSWKELAPQKWLNDSIFAMKQDVKLLSANIIRLGSGYLKEICDSKGFDAANFDFVLPHISSDYFKKLLLDQFQVDGMDIPEEKCFFNLNRIGNIGAASIYVALNELMGSGRLEKGQKILLMVPESARFSYTNAMLTVC